MEHAVADRIDNDAYVHLLRETPIIKIGAGTNNRGGYLFLGAGTVFTELYTGAPV